MPVPVRAAAATTESANRSFLLKPVCIVQMIRHNDVSKGKHNFLLHVSYIGISWLL
jgi:hypothetical protein